MSQKQPKNGTGGLTMAKCERCYHKPICIYNAFNVYNNSLENEECEHFKDKSELPCKYGKWLINCDGYYPYCSECGEEPVRNRMSNYCPNCGARMEKAHE